MKIGIPKEIAVGEKRVATTPEAAAQLIKLGFSVCVETGAGAKANISDEAYRAAGVELLAEARQVWQQSDLIIKVRAPMKRPRLNVDEIEWLPEGRCLVCFVWPAQNPELMDALAAKKTTVLAMDCVPRISRAQKMDALSSMANIAGYRAIVEAAQVFGRFFTGQITAAGKIPPAKVLVIGAGVAGLAAIGAAKSMGAIVRAFDTRPEVKEQVESMDAEFLMLAFEEDGSGAGGYAKTMSPEFIAAEMALFAQQAKEVDIIVTTALIPGKPAPKLITAEMVRSMKPGSVIVDLAAEQGGNCALTEQNKAVVKHGVTLIGYTDLPSRLANQSSQLYATNLRHLLADLCLKKDGTINVNMDDEVIRGATVIKDGKITWPAPPPILAVAATKPTAAPAPHLEAEHHRSKADAATRWTFLVIAAAVLLGLGSILPASFMAHFTVFVLACFVGYQVIWNVTPSLHTPLMSVTNAISGIIVIGAILEVSAPSELVSWLATFAVLIASINIVGGFWVTRRMLGMFRK